MTQRARAEDVLSPKDVVSLALAGARSAAYFSLYQLTERVSAFPWGTRGTYAHEELERVRTLLGRIASSRNEERSITAVTSRLNLARPSPAQKEAQRAFSRDVLLRLRALVHASAPTAVDGKDVEPISGLALDVMTPAADLLVSVSLLGVLARLDEKAGAATAFLAQERELQGMLIEESRTGVMEALERFERAASSRTDLSPSVRDAIEACRVHIAEMNAAWVKTTHTEHALTRIEGLCHRLAEALELPPEPLTSSLPRPSAEEIDLARRIVESPLDLELRERFAELAASRGDPRGALVRDHVELRKRRLAKLRACRDVTWDYERESPLSKALQARYGDEWTADVKRLGATAARMAGGFVEEITIAASRFVENAEALFRAAPLRSAVIRCPSRELPILLACPHLARLDALSLAGSGLTTSDIAMLVPSAQHLAGLVLLDLSGNAIGREGMLLLAEATQRGPLTGLFAVVVNDPLHALYTLEYTLQEIPTQELVATELGREIEQACPNHRLRTDGQAPSLDVLPEIRELMLR